MGQKNKQTTLGLFTQLKCFFISFSIHLFIKPLKLSMSCDGKILPESPTIHCQLPASTNYMYIQQLGQIKLPSSLYIHMVHTDLSLQMLLLWDFLSLDNSANEYFRTHSNHNKIDLCWWEVGSGKFKIPQTLLRWDA